MVQSRAFTRADHSVMVDMERTLAQLPSARSHQIMRAELDGALQQRAERRFRAAVREYLQGDETALQALEMELDQGDLPEQRAGEIIDEENGCGRVPQRAKPGFMTTVKAAGLVLLGCAVLAPVAIYVDDARAQERSRAAGIERAQAKGRYSASTPVEVPAKPKGEYSAPTPVELPAGAVEL